MAVSLGKPSAGGRGADLDGTPSRREAAGDPRDPASQMLAWPRPARNRYRKRKPISASSGSMITPAIAM
jgi:hypothetical protein